MRLLVLDIETTGLNPFYNDIRGIGRYLPDRELFKYDKVLGNGLLDYSLCYHNGKFDINFLKRKGYHGLRLDHDTMLAASLLPAAQDVGLKLKDLAKYYLKEEDWKVDHDTEVSDEELEEHCKKDCIITSRLMDKCIALMKKEGVYKYYLNNMLPAARLLMKMEYDGVRIDAVKLKELKGLYDNRLLEAEEGFRYTYSKEIKAAEQELLKLALGKCKPGKRPETLINRKQKVLDNPPSFNLNSNVHIGVFLDIIGVVVTSKEGKKTTSSKALPYYINIHNSIEGIIRYRETKKLTEFLHLWDKCRVGDYLYPSFNLHTTRTGRLSSSAPNLQQVAGDLKDIFIAHDGNVLVVVDYSQIEPRLTAHFSGDKKLIQVFKDGIDLYGTIAVGVLRCKCHPNEVKEKYPKERDMAKVITLAVTYGMGGKTLQYSLKYNNGIEVSAEEAGNYIKAFYKQYPAVKRYKYRLGGTAARDGYLSGWFGRKLWLNREDAAHKALNYFIQNAASDLTLFTQIGIAKKLEGIAKLKLLVHDECVWECKEENVEKVLAVIEHYMVYSMVGKLTVPLKIESYVGKTWGVKK